MKCLSWDESKEKVVNVICLIKCEAKKSASSAEASKIIQESRVSVIKCIFRLTCLFGQMVFKKCITFLKSLLWLFTVSLKNRRDLPNTERSI